MSWFQGLMPKQGRFFELFEAHGALLVDAAQELKRLFVDQGDRDAHVAVIARLEREADEIAREVMQEVRRVFVTPFDRSAITRLVNALDDAIDQMNKTAKAIQLFDIQQYNIGMESLAELIAHATHRAAEALPLLRSVSRNSGKLHDLAATLVELEDQADELHAEGVRFIFDAATEGELLGFIIRREVYSHLEKVMDRLEDVANEIQGLVVEHA